MFDRIISIDWSGAGPETERVALRVAVWDRATGSCEIKLPVDGAATRNWQRAECRDFLIKALMRRDRTLVAMDFGFGLAWGADEVVFGVRGWRAMIRRIAEVYAESGTARGAAMAINAWPHLSGHGPYRFNENRTDYRFYLDRGVAYFRLTELAAPQAISQWYLGSGGTVGFHTISGLSAIDALVALREKGQVRFAVWPFEEIRPEDHVLVESYPAICPKCADDPSCNGDDERDAWKVLQHLVAANRTGQITEWFGVPERRFGRVQGVEFDEQVRFEGFIFGLR